MAHRRPAPRRPLPWPMRPIAHRGLHDESSGVIENTLPAVEAAIAHDYDVEIDVVASADGVPMVFHDDTLEQLTTASGAVAARTAEELAAITFRQRLRGAPCHASTRMPTLSQVLSAAEARCTLYIEIKSSPFTPAIELTDAVAALVASSRCRAAVMSFDPAVVARCATVLPLHPRGFISGRYTGPDWADAPLGPFARRARRWLLAGAMTRIDFLNLETAMLPGAAPTFWSRALGCPVLAWTVRSQTEAERLRDHADAIVFENFSPVDPC